MPATMPKRRFTVDEYHRMTTAGVLRPEERVELLDGEVVESAPTGSRHAACVRRLESVIGLALEGRALVGVQNPVRLSPFSEPLPDLSVLRPRPDRYAERPPGPEDVLLVIEVCDTTHDFDNRVKGPLYARAGIAEYWMVDVEGGCIEIRRGPGPDGYEDIDFAATGQRARPAAFHDVALRVDDLVG